MAHPWTGPAHGSSFAGAPSSALEAVRTAGWSWAPEVVAPIVVLGTVYAVGWYRLWRRSPRGSARTRATGQAAAACVGLGSITVALLSPIDGLSQVSFVAHMVQHLLLISVAAPALLLADPLPVALWGLPAGARAIAGRLLARAGPLRRPWRALTAMTVSGCLYAATLWLWHHPSVYDVALEHTLVHHLEHLTFFLAALLFWWPVICPAPRVRRPSTYEGRIVYLVLVGLQSSALALLLALSPTVWYRTYVSAPPIAGLTPLDDQAWGGIVMWAAGGVADMLALGLLLWKFLNASERAAPAPLLPHRR